MLFSLIRTLHYFLLTFGGEGWNGLMTLPLTSMMECDLKYVLSDEQAHGKKKWNCYVTALLYVVWGTTGINPSRWNMQVLSYSRQVRWLRAWAWWPAFSELHNRDKSKTNTNHDKTQPFDLDFNDVKLKPITSSKDEDSQKHKRQQFKLHTYKQYNPSPFPPQAKVVACSHPLASRQARQASPQDKPSHKLDAPSPWTHVNIMSGFKTCTAACHIALDQGAFIAKWGATIFWNLRPRSPSFPIHPFRKKAPPSPIFQKIPKAAYKLSGKALSYCCRSPDFALRRVPVNIARDIDFISVRNTHLVSS